MSRLDYLRAIVTRMRKYAGYWTWPDKRRRELGVVEELLKTMRWRGTPRYHSPKNAPQDPPDCTMRAVDESIVGVEVSELVCREAARRNQKGERVYRDWQPQEVLREVGDRLREKDTKTYRGGPYAKIIAIIHTDEPVIAYESYEPLLADELFGPLVQIQEAYFLFSYDPNHNYCPYVQLRLSSSAAGET